MRSLLLTIFVLIGANANAQETKTSMGFVLSPNFSSVRYNTNGNSSQSYLEVIESATSGAIGLSGNIFFQYELLDKLFITWGLGVQNYRFSTRYESVNQGGSNSLKTIYSQYYLELNASVKYRIYKTLYARAGIGADVLADPRKKAIKPCPSCDEVVKTNDNPSNFKEAMLPLSFGLGYELKLTDRLNLMTELFGTMIVTDALDLKPNSNMIQRKPVQLGFSLGVIRSF